MCVRVRWSLTAYGCALCCCCLPCLLDMFTSNPSSMRSQSFVLEIVKSLKISKWAGFTVVPGIDIPGINTSYYQQYIPKVGHSIFSCSRA